MLSYTLAIFPLALFEMKDVMLSAYKASLADHIEGLESESTHVDITMTAQISTMSPMGVLSSTDCSGKGAGRTKTSAVPISKCSSASSRERRLYFCMATSHQQTTEPMNGGISSAKMLR